MARSTYIYVVEAAYNEYPRIVAAFTVKHELRTWLHRNPGDYNLWRVPDGGHGQTKELVL